MYNNSSYVVLGYLTGELVNAQISEAEEGQTRLIALVSVTADILKARLGTAVVFRVEVAIVVKDLCTGKGNALTLLCRHLKLKIACEVLVEVNNSLTLWSFKNPVGQNSFLLQNVLALLLYNNFVAVILYLYRNKDFLIVCVVNLSVVNVGKTDFTVSTLPALVRANNGLLPIFVCNGKLTDKGRVKLGELRSCSYVDSSVKPTAG